MALAAWAFVARARNRQSHRRTIVLPGIVRCSGVISRLDATATCGVRTPATSENSASFLANYESLHPRLGGGEGISLGAEPIIAIAQRFSPPLTWPAQNLRSGQLTAVWLPDKAHEVMRELIRMRVSRPEQVEFARRFNSMINNAQLQALTIVLSESRGYGWQKMNSLLDKCQILHLWSSSMHQFCLLWSSFPLGP